MRTSGPNWFMRARVCLCVPVSKDWTTLVQSLVESGCTLTAQVQVDTNIYLSKSTISLFWYLFSLYFSHILITAHAVSVFCLFSLIVSVLESKACSDWFFQAYWNELCFLFPNRTGLAKSVIQMHFAFTFLDIIASCVSYWLTMLRF